MAQLTEDILTEQNVDEEHHEEILLKQEVVNTAAAIMADKLVHEGCYDSLALAAGSMRKAFIEVDFAFREYLEEVKGLVQANSSNTAAVAAFDMTGFSTDYWDNLGRESTNADGTTRWNGAWHTNLAASVDRQNIRTTNLINAWEEPPQGTSAWVPQLKQLTTLMRNMHEAAAAFGTPLVTEVNIPNAPFTGNTNAYEDVNAAANAAANRHLSTIHQNTFLGGSRMTGQGAFRRVAQTSDFAGMPDYVSRSEAYSSKDVLSPRNSTKLQHWPAAADDDKATVSNLFDRQHIASNYSPSQKVFWFMIDSRSPEKLRETRSDGFAKGALDGLVANYVRNTAIASQHVRLHDLPRNTEPIGDQALYKQDIINTREKAIALLDTVKTAEYGADWQNTIWPDPNGKDESLKSWTVEFSNAYHAAGEESEGYEDASEMPYIPSGQINLFRTWGTFKQMSDTFRMMTTSPRFSTSVSGFITNSTQMMNIAISNFLAAQQQLFDAWSCVTRVVKPYTDQLHEFKKLLFQAKDASDWGPGDLPLIPGDGVDNSEFNALMGAINAESAFSRVEASVERNIFKEQCFLLSYMKKLAEVKKARDSGPIPTAPWTIGTEPKKYLPYVGNNCNSTLLLDGDPYGLINKMTQGEGSSTFFNTDSEVISHLQPMIRLYKVTYDDDGNAYEDEFVFESSAVGLEAMLQDKRRRGAGVGVQSFDFAYEGSNPFAVKKSISATLKVFASSMDELLEPRKSSNNRDIAFADLALKTRNPTPSQSPGQQSQTPGAVPVACSAPTSSASPSNLSATQNANLDKLTFRLKAVVGWAHPNGNGPWEAVGRDVIPQNEKQKLYNGIWDSSITLNLTPTVHSFEFDDLGRTVMNVNYLAYVDDFYDQPAFNVFASDISGADSPTAKQLVRNMLLEHYTEHCSGTDDDGNSILSNVKENMADAVDSEKKQLLQQLVTSLAEKEKIYTLRLNIDSIAHFLSRGPFLDWDPANPPFDLTLNATSADSDTAAENLADAIDSFDGFEAEEGTNSRSNLFKSGLAATDPKNETVPFIFVSDLIDCILENIEGELLDLPNSIVTAMRQAPGASSAGLDQGCRIAAEQQKLRKLKRAYEKLRIVLGPLEVVDQAQTSPSNILHCTFGDVPIALKYFLEWMTEQMAGQHQTIYSLTRFINDLFNKLIQDFLNDGSCFGWDIKPGGKVRVNQTVVTSYPSAPSVDEITTYCTSHALTRANVGDIPRPVFRLSGDPGVPSASGLVSQEMNYFVFFAGRVAPIDQMNGNKEEDEEKGIYHYMIGRNKGLIKTIKLSKTDSQGLAEVRFEQEGYEGLEQLRVLYDADIDMYSNVKTFPGTYIFVDPRGFAPTTNLDCGDPMNLTQYGVGGYMMIIKSEHSFGPGKAETKLHAKWVYGISNCTGTQDSNIGQQGVANPTGNSSPAQCQGSLTAARATSAGSTTP